MVHPKRGTKAMEAMGVLPRFAGVAVHDAWAPYDTYTAPDHQLCCAQYAEPGIMRNGAARAGGLPGGAGLVQMPGAGSSA